MSEQETALEYLETALRYIVGSSDKVSVEELNQIVQEVLQEGAKVMPTIAEQWLEQGREEGLQKGLERGREEGREEGRETALMLLRRYLATRFEIPLAALDGALAGCDLAALIQLSQVAFAANSLAEFEAALTELTANQRVAKDNPAYSTE